MIWFSADYHLGHPNIIKYCGRPFVSIKEHDDTIIANHNSKVKPNDTLYFLGDYCFGNRDKAAKYIERLNGNLRFIWGNHDHALQSLQRHQSLPNCYPYLGHTTLKRVQFLGDYKKIRVEGQKIMLFHYAGRVWDCSHHGAWQLYGHSHGTLPDDPHALSMDVGVDCHNYTPISFEEVKQFMAKKLWKPVDYHGTKELKEFA